MSGKKRILKLTFQALGSTSYTALEPGVGITIKSLKQNLPASTIVTDKAIPVTNTESTSFSISTVLAAFFHLFRK